MLLRACCPAAAQRPGVSVDDVERLACGTAALRDGKVLGEHEFFQTREHRWRPRGEEVPGSVPRLRRPC